jgi:hypothetical protein
MNRRPRSITVISWIFVAVGVVALAYHASEFNVQRPLDYDLVLREFKDQVQRALS